LAFSCDNFDSYSLLFLVENGCDYIQGYLYSKPLPADEFEKFIKTFKKAV